MKKDLLCPRILTTPITIDDIRDLRAGDVFYLSGRVITGRDDVHRRIVREQMASPVDFRGNALFHAGPIVREEQNTIISVGPTTSMRMEDLTAEFIARTGVRVIIGKGGMGPKTAAVCKEHGAIHCVFPGGCAVTAATLVEKIEAVHWRELGMPECLWVLRVKEFGPLIVTIDTLGNNLYGENKRLYAERKEAAMAPIIESVRDIM
ncbi:L(+)-tartrate dehydratase subunit beta [Spirochaetia bacterium]|nr:L(+)-tartrate dehydratase subunit beta [Spirochaetia bacterium]